MNGNRPGQDVISFRAGTYGSLLRAMLFRLSVQAVEHVPGQPVRPLAALTTRDADDFGIALLDAWAVVGDVLTFYGERIANEGFLRTATERRSVLELARLIGYELGPGVAASAFLQFTVDSPAGMSRPAGPVSVPRGARVASVPGQDELPQTFQTSTDVTARAEWNVLRPRQLRPQQLAVSDGRLRLLGGGPEQPVEQIFPLDLDVVLPASGTVAASEVDTLYVTGTSANLVAADVLLFAGRRSGDAGTKALVRTVRRAVAEPELDRTRVELDVEPVAPLLRRIGTLSAAIAGIQLASLDSANVEALVVSKTWTEGELSAWLSVQGWDATSTVDYIYRAYSAPKPAPAAPADPGAFAMRTKLGFFGHNAPAFGGLTSTAQAPYFDWDSGLSVWRDSMRRGLDSPGYYGDADCFLERTVAGVTANSWAVLELPGTAGREFTAFRVRASTESSLAGYSLSTKATGLRLGPAADGAALAGTTTDKPESFAVRKTTAHVMSDRMTLAQLPIDDPLGAGTPEQAELTLDRMVLNLVPGQLLGVGGERDDLPGVTVAEVVTLAGVRHAGGFTTLQFSLPGLQFRYVRSTVTLSANVAAATHGESVTEVLGSGDGGTPNQGFALRKPPLTYTASAGASGAASSLEIRVDGIAWRAAPSFTGLSGADQVYVVRRGEDGSVVVLFGDGVQGARLPTGVENVVADYRSGIGMPGMVRPASLTLLMTRPLGIRDVTNPLPASGAADPEPRDAARANAPLTVLTMDRIVSLQDAEDFTRAFAGVGKCTAVALWRRGRLWVHLTVAATAATPGSTGPADHRLDPASALRTNLEAAIQAAREPSISVRIDTYQPLFFDVAARVLADPRFRWADVEAAVTAELVATFGFDRRSFGQAVGIVEVTTTIQRVPGVVFVDVDAVHRFDQPASLPPGGVLAADGVVWSDDDPEPTSLAQLLGVNPLGVTLTQIPQGSIT